MTLQEFNTKSLSLRADAIYEWGFFISSHKGSGINKVLYALYDFFAEESIALSNNGVVEVRGFSKPELSKQELDVIRREKPFLLSISGLISVKA